MTRAGHGPPPNCTARCNALSPMECNVREGAVMPKREPPWNAEPRLRTQGDAARSIYQQSARKQGQRQRTKNHWLARAQRDGRGEPRPNLFNAVLALREEPQTVN